MIDPENPLLRKGGATRIVDVAAGGEIGAERLFQADTGLV
jgi:hypothetical protein